ncbi:MAG: MltR family transcriptional regulator [Alphaproteobacteria bacterium]
MNDVDNEIVNAVAEALLQTSMERARKEASELEFDMSDSIPVFRKLVSETDTGIAIIASAYIDECLKNLFMLYVRHSSKKSQNSLFEFNGPLGTFSSRIHTASAFDFISEKTYLRLNIIRKIRNDFAHRPFDLSFNKEEIKQRINEIDVNHKSLLTNIRKIKDAQKITKPPSKLTMKEEFLIRSILTLSNMSSEMIIFPIAKANRVSASTILRNYDDLPENLKDIKKKTAACIFEIFKAGKAR